MKAKFSRSGRTLRPRMEFLEQRHLLTAELVLDLNAADLGVDPSETVVLRGEVYFASKAGKVRDAELWKSDGTKDGTSLVTTIAAPPSYFESARIIEMTVVGEHLYFVVEHTLADEHLTYEFYRSDGTAEGTELVRKQLEGDWPYSFGVRSLLVGEDSSFLTVNTGSIGGVVWTIFVAEGDGSFAAGRTFSSCITQGGRAWCEQPHLAVNGDRIYYSHQRHTRGVPASFDVELTSYDGATRSKESVTLSSGLSFPKGDHDVEWEDKDWLAQDLTWVGDLLYFTFDDQIHGRELWVSDGTQAGTHMVADVNDSAQTSDPTQLTSHNGKLYFLARDAQNERRVWSVEANGVQIAATPGFVPIRIDGTNGPYITVTGSGNRASTLWRTDGSELTQVESIPTNPRKAVVLGDLLLFTTAMEGQADALWKLDLNTNDLVSLGEIGSDAKDFMVVGDQVWFTSDTPFGTEIFVTDGFVVEPIDTPFRSGSLSTGRQFSLAVHSEGSSTGEIVLGFQSGIETLNVRYVPVGLKLLRTDGTTDGTVLAGSIRVWGIGEAVQVGPDIFISASSSDEPWTRIDTTSNRSHISSAEALTSADPRYQYHTDPAWLAHIRFDGVPIEPRDRIRFESRSYLAASTSHGDYSLAGTVDTGFTLIRRDSKGTVEDLSAVLLAPLGITARHSGYSARFEGIQVLGDIVYFLAEHPEYGEELWQTDGTLAGTQLAADIAPGPGSSDIELLRGSGDTLFMIADDGIHGRELWKLKPPTTGSDLDEDGDVDLDDFHLLAATFGAMLTPGGRGDLDKNGTVDFKDFLILAADVGKPRPR